MTAIEAHPDGHWLRIEPLRYPAAPAAKSYLRRRLLVAVAVVAVVAVGAVRLSGLTSGSAQAADPVPRVSDVGATAPAPPAPMAESFERWGREYDVPVPLLEALTWHESRWQPQAVSEAGAVGLGQLMPATAAAVAAAIGEDLDRWDADDNVRMSSHLLGTLLRSSGGDARVALAGYAQGAGSVARSGMTATTQQYVDEIMALYAQFATT